MNPDLREAKYQAPFFSRVKAFCAFCGQGRTGSFLAFIAPVPCAMIQQEAA